MIRIGVDFGGTKIEAAALDADGRFLARTRVSTPATYEDCLTATRDVLAEAERLMVSTDCGMGREGMSRRHAFYKAVAITLGTNIVRKELGAPEARVPAADERYSLVVPAK